MCTGSHILSGAALDPTYLTELIPNWKELGVSCCVWFFLVERFHDALVAVGAVENADQERRVPIPNVERRNPTAYSAVVAQ